MTAIELRAAQRVSGVLRVPGDKSISHRALLFNALSRGPAKVAGLGPGADIASTIAAIEALGARVEREGEDVVRIDRACSWSADGPIDCGNSGTTARLLMGALAPRARRAVELIGDASLARRPMARVIEPLRWMGAEIEGGDTLPVTVTGSALRGRDHDLPVASAQVKSALLLAGLRADDVTTVREPGPSRDHTERMLIAMGAPIESSGGSVSIRAAELDPIDVEVPGDLSSAAPFIALAAARSGHSITIEDVGLNPTRTGLIDLVHAFGASVTVEAEADGIEPVGVVRVEGAELDGIDVPAEIVPRAIDELPLVAVIATQAAGETRVEGAAELRVKESDRIATIVSGLRAMGASIEALSDGFSVEGPTRLRGARVDSAGDHRIGMALAVAALLAEGTTTIDGVEWVDVSYPGFFRDLGRCVETSVLA